MKKPDLTLEMQVDRKPGFLARELDATPCEQCNGTGLLKGGQRCPCREEDDTADQMRSRMGIVRKMPE